MRTGFFWDESCFWHGGGNYASMMPVGGLVQPMVNGGLPESPESKRRFKNLLDMTGLSGELAMQSADAASTQDLLRVHPKSYLDQFKAMSDAGGGEIGLRCSFGPGGYEIAAQSSGLAIGALNAVLKGDVRNAYSLSRPPGHHCMPDEPMGFCLLANIAIAVEAARAAGLTKRVAVLDWDVHHGNGTEAIFYDRADVLTVSIHQENNFPVDTGRFEDRGQGAGEGFNLNIPLPAGAGHASYLEVMEAIVLPRLRAYQPEVIIVACGFDATIIDPLGRMSATAETFKRMTHQVMALADDICDGRLVMVHEGGYSEVYVPFCGHGVLEQMSGSNITAPDPMAALYEKRQPGQAHQRFVSGEIAQMRDALGL
ncbi:MAG: class II histone deacetylase [Planktotalea sp.]|uniref:class II histone deacetylase n=1 Tax=Planktotalea sp. TaxID=2029877 RepID=UPI003C785B85